MKKVENKIVLIGAGIVGNTFLYAAMNQGLAQEYVLIDAFSEVADGNKLDFEDTLSVLPTSFASVKVGDYSDCKNADIIVICAGRSLKPGETRLDLAGENAKIMKTIALQVKNSGFQGITAIASNPVDVLTLVYQEVTGFDHHRVIGSGTLLDSSRLKFAIGTKLGVAPRMVETYLMGEHGDSSFPVYSNATIMNEPISKFISRGEISQTELDEMASYAKNKGYEIFNKRKATSYGIGACLARIVKAVLTNEKATLMVGAKVNGEYGLNGLYLGVPAIISSKGIEKIIIWDLDQKERASLENSANCLKTIVDVAFEAIK